MIPRRTVEEILDASKIEEVVGDFVTLKRRGANLIACCPFHNEKTPSFYVSPAKGIFKCFGCGKSGTAVGFVMEHENLSYSEALKYLAKKYHIEVVEKEETAEEIAQRQHSESLLLVSEFAQKFFQQQLRKPDGQIGWAYFKSRGLEDDTIEKFGLGWAPNSRNALQIAAREAGFKQDYLVDTGLCFRTDDGKVMDRFYDRVVFPIHNIAGRVIAFGCRTLKNDKGIAKYINSPETEIYLKRHTLYGMYQAKNEVHKQDKFILVEGYLDVISMHQLGITNVAASSGTSLTVEQVQLIKRYTDNVTIIYDGDAAGIHAALRGIGLVLEGGLNVKVVLLPDGDDPDSYSRKHSRQEVEDFIKANEQDFIAFKTRMLLDEAGNDPIKKAGLINDIADTIALIPDPVKRSVYVQMASEQLGVEEGLLLGRIKNTRAKALEEKRRERERQQEREQQGSAHADVPQGSDAPWPDDAPPADDRDYDSQYQQPLPVPPANGVVLNDRVMAPCEKELLGFVLRDGRKELVFDSDSEYYDPEHVPTVAEFIDACLYEDGARFANEAYYLTYEKYLDLYQQGLAEDQMSVRLLSDENPLIRAVAKDMLEEKHQLTVKKFEAALTNQSTLLAIFVPKALLTFNLARLNADIKKLSRQLKGSAETDQEGILRQIMEMTKLRNKLTIKLGRV